MIRPILDEFEEAPVVVGHSFGGRVAVCLAATEGPGVRSLVLTGVPLVRRGSSAKPAAAFRLAKYLNRLGLLSDERMETEKRKRGSADYRAATGIMRDILVKVVNESYESELAGLGVPVAMVWGSEDHEVPAQVGREALDIILSSGGSATLDLVDGVGHHTPVEAVSPLRDLIAEALDS